MKSKGNEMTSEGRALRVRARGTAAILAGVLSLAGVYSALAETGPDQQIADALLQEGTILQEQTAKLQPAGAQLDVERRRLQAEEAQLTDEIKKVNKSFQDFNAAADQLNASMKHQREECEGGTSNFQSEVDTCNGKALALKAEGERLATHGKELDKQQEELNKRIEAHNAAGREWNRRTQEHQQKWAPGIQEVQRWIGRFNEFLGSSTFSQFAQTAGNPQECSDERLGALNPGDALPSLTRALRCLKALKTGAG